MQKEISCYNVENMTLHMIFFRKRNFIYSNIYLSREEFLLFKNKAYNKFQKKINSTRGKYIKFNTFYIKRTKRNMF